MFQKRGIYLYQYSDSLSKLDDPFKPDKECFYNSKSDVNIADLYYKFDNKTYGICYL